MIEPINVIDLCCGAGGWACAARGLPIKIVAAFDLWGPAIQTYKINHPETEAILGDLRDDAVQRNVLRIAKKHKVRLVLGGIPCEWLSSYRSLNPVQAKELAAQRATLDCVLSLVKKINPRWWCMEDVKALIKELPPMTKWNEINARRYSAQRRKRIYVGDFPLPGPCDCKDVLRDKLRPGPYRIGARAFGRTAQLARTFSSSTTLAAPIDRKSPTICATCSRRDAEMVIVDPRFPTNRNMEWQEAAVIQGFPEDYLFFGNPSDVMKQVGRAIQIDTGRAILKAIVAQAERD